MSNNLPYFRYVLSSDLRSISCIFAMFAALMRGGWGDFDREKTIIGKFGWYFKQINRGHVTGFLSGLI